MIGEYADNPYLVEVNSGITPNLNFPSSYVQDNYSRMCHCAGMSDRY